MNKAGARSPNDPYPALVSGARIMNAITGRPGTLGCIGLDADDKPWIVSCYHVLGRGRQFLNIVGNDEPILQSMPDLGSRVVARTRIAKMNSVLDFGAAIVTQEVDVSPSVLELDKLQRVADAAVGMKVLKSGATTGVTMGVVAEVTPILITIETPADVPDGYILADRRDSGAVWMDAHTGNAVGLHFTSRDNSVALARPLRHVLGDLALRLLE
ncbi:MAG: hypothetical protein ABI408_04370 [Gemmatimonadaceae bacterium]